MLRLPLPCGTSSSRSRRLQYSDKSRYSGAVDCLAQSVRTEGVGVLWRGFCVRGRSCMSVCPCASALSVRACVRPGCEVYKSVKGGETDIGATEERLGASWSHREAETLAHSHLDVEKHAEAEKLAREAESRKGES